ncbi:phenylalanine 4-monooxygenase [Microlunatus elymi]|uniref:Phenylalanine 4-monooxygenase n=1 Tax=Microlunatus elymi TaxID=2596828 RepID=A0A516Q2K7_9ACTN|nr:phenylalanine 4-monooxygenase [Microlunatus elymi]QDP97638.1 phenylalanine 4-monooxygenase [Microlunatus elymi]
MFEEGQLYSPVTRQADGQVEVHLGENHPGFKDEHYRARRNEIAAVATDWDPREPVPHIDYTDEENRIWATVCTELAPKHEHYAHSEYLAAKQALGLPTDHVPQLEQVTASIKPLTGWTYITAPGLVELREFYSSLGDKVFHSTQYLRHPSEPLYTPEPDIIHEVIGHANQLASPRFSTLTAAAGRAAQRLQTEDALKFLADVFWFSLEFGVIHEDGLLKAYGAGILSSYGEMDEFRQMEIRPLDIGQMGTLNYDITSYQPILFAADSLDQLDDVVGVFFETCDDETPDRVRRELHLTS